MKIFKNFIGLAALALCLGFASCSSDDDAPSYSNVAVSNSELMTILKAKGYQFDENGKMLLDDKANSTTSLDLSGTKVDTAALKELSVFPNLKALNLSNNGYGPVFHIASLPSQITGLDLQGNDIYDFDGLVTAKVENDEVKATILHEFTKLYLPASCKYNVEDLMPFYTENEAENKTIDMQMVNDKGSLEKYNTLREIPDEYFRAYLKMKFASLFADDTHIDISKPMKNNEQGESLTLGLTNQFADVNKIQSISGIECFINNPYYQPFFVSIAINNNVLFETKYLDLHSNIKGLMLNNVNTTEGINFANATSLVALTLTHNDGIKEADLSNTLISAQDIKDFDATLQNYIAIKYCKNLETLLLPKTDKGVVNACELIQLPKLKSVDLSSIKGLEALALVVLPNCSITYPNLKYTYYSQDKTLVELSEFDYILFAISEDVYKMESTKNFFAAHTFGLGDNGYSYMNDGAYLWQ